VPRTPNGYEDLFDRLADRRVDFVIVGGVAFTLRGSARATFDLDLCYDRRKDNLSRMSRALLPFTPTLRGAPAGLPFKLDPETLAAGLNFTLDTTIGPVDLLGELSGIGTYDVVLRLSSRLVVYGHEVDVLSLEGLERAKRAAGRRKDLLDIAEILEIRRQIGE
jgi:hypothetical protein